MTSLRERGRALRWASVHRMVAVRHPGVPTISTADLAMRLADPEPPLMLDVRTAAEFAVSHLQGARRVEPGATLPADVLALDRGTRIVAYCSVGVRSAACVHGLKGAGFHNASNLAGSIFQWANEGRPVFRGGRAVDRVHPYDARWGDFLDSHRRIHLLRP